MRNFLLLVVYMTSPLMLQAQEVVVNKQRNFPRTVPAGNYSGITWLGGNRYAVVNDKSETAGFYLMTIDLDSLSGDILQVRCDTFLTCGHENRDEEGVCYFPERNTVFVSGEADGQILEYTMDGRLTGRRLSIPDVFVTAHRNGGFEALTYNARTNRFWTTSEVTLKADGQKPTVHCKIANRLRLQSFDDSLSPREQYFYETDLPMTRKDKGKLLLGVSGLAAMDDGRVIVLEREIYKSSKNIGSFVQVKLYVVTPAQHQPGELLRKQLLASFRTKMNLTKRSFANYEGLCLGPRLADGRQVLLLVCDSQNQYRGYLKDWFRSIVIL